MSIKIGIGFGGWPFPSDDPEHLWRYVDTCEELDIDSIWLSDRIVSPLLNMEPIVALSFAAARTKNLKFGTSVIALPLRNPTILAKEIATLDFLSGGRSLPRSRSWALRTPPSTRHAAPPAAAASAAPKRQSR